MQHFFTNKIVIIHAPNIHTGGGIKLLQQILNSNNLPEIKFAQFDKRVTQYLKIPNILEKYFVKPKFFSRLLAEYNLRNKSKKNDIIICFHSLPPLLPVKAKTFVFVQNNLLTKSSISSDLALRTKLRIFVERLWLRYIRPQNIKYIVQTESMMLSLKKYLGKDIDIAIIPFAPINLPIRQDQNVSKKYDFIYPASGEAHKNHNNLLKAWCLMAKDNVRPSLAVTIDSKSYPTLTKKFENYILKFNLNIINLSHLSIPDALTLYESTSALIFPSKAESFGLPLIEATQFNIPIIASELDYVRDIATPVETFDPRSARSIARAVRRFLNNSEPEIKIHTGEEFWEAIFK